MQIESFAVIFAIVVCGSSSANGQAAEAEAPTPAVDQYGRQLPADVFARLSAVSFPHPCPLYAWAYSPDGNTLVSLAEDQIVRFWNTADGRLMHKLDPPPAVIVPWPGRLAVSPDGRRAAIAYGSVWVRIVDLQAAKVLHDIQRLRPDVVRDGWHAVVFFGNSTLLLSSQESSYWIDPETGKVQSRAHPGTFVARAAAADICALANTSNSLELIHLQMADGPRFHAASALAMQADRALALSPDGRLVAFSSAGRIRKEGVELAEHASTVIEVYEVSTNRLSSYLQFPRVLIDHLKFSPNGRMLVASGPEDAAVWEIRSGERLTELPASPNHLRYVFSPDGSKLSGVGDGTTIAQWNMAALAKSASSSHR